MKLDFVSSNVCVRVCVWGGVTYYRFFSFSSAIKRLESSMSFSGVKAFCRKERQKSAFCLEPFGLHLVI